MSSIDSTKLKDSLRKVELIKNEGIKAIENINFYISEKQFEIEIKLFQSPRYNKKEYHYQLGEYKFYNVEASFLNDSLLNTHFWGDKR